MAKSSFKGILMVQLEYVNKILNDVKHSLTVYNKDCLVEYASKFADASITNRGNIKIVKGEVIGYLMNTGQIWYDMSSVDLESQHYEDLKAELLNRSVSGLEALGLRFGYSEDMSKETYELEYVTYRDSDLYFWDTEGIEDVYYESLDGSTTTVLVDGVSVCCRYDFGAEYKKVRFCPVCGKKIVGGNK